MESIRETNEMYNGYEKLKQVSERERVTILYEYLVLGESMDQIAQRYYNNKNWIISTVCKGYSEKGGINRGRAKGATIEDVRQFIRTYPYGTYDIGITFLDFLGHSGFDSQVGFNNFNDNASYSPPKANAGKESVLELLLGGLFLGLIVWFVVGKWMGHPFVALIIIGFLVYGLVSEMKGR